MILLLVHKFLKYLIFVIDFFKSREHLFHASQFGTAVPVLLQRINHGRQAALGFALLATELLLGLLWRELPQILLSLLLILLGELEPRLLACLYLLSLLLLGNLWASVLQTLYHHWV